MVLARDTDIDCYVASLRADETAMIEMLDTWRFVEKDKVRSPMVPLKAFICVC